MVIGSNITGKSYISNQLSNRLIESTSYIFNFIIKIFNSYVFKRNCTNKDTHISLIVCLFQTYCKLNVYFKEQSKWSGIINVFIILFKKLFDQPSMTTSGSAVYLQENRL